MQKKRKKSIIILFYLYPFILTGHLAYGLIIREPYPSLMMPGFSKIDNNGSEYKLTDFNIILQSDSIVDTVNLKKLAYPFSKIAISRAIDLTYFRKDLEKNYNSMQKKYYAIIKSLIGEKNYQKYIISIRHPEISPNQKNQFTTWLIKRIRNQKNIENFNLAIEKESMIRDLRSNSIKRSTIISKINL